MNLSSPKISFDPRLLAIEEQFRQRRHQHSLRELRQLSEDDFGTHLHERALYLLLSADGSLIEGNYKDAVEDGLKAAKILGEFPLNRRYGRAQLVLSKAYRMLGDLKNAEIRGRDAVAAYRRATDVDGQVDSLNQLAGIAYLHCDYSACVNFLETALGMIGDNPRKVAQLTGNLGRTRIRTGQWVQAEKDLEATVKRNHDNHEDMSEAMNLLSLGLLQMIKRQFLVAQRSLDCALEIINRIDLKYERVIYLEYAGELAYEKGDIFKAKAILSEAYRAGLTLSPGSALVSQSARRLAEVELTLDNFDEAMKYGQKALELALALGEKLEIGLSRSVIARVFAAQADYEAALEHGRTAIEVLKDVGDPYELARTLLVYSDICMAAQCEDSEKVRASLDEAHRLFRRLKLNYWMSEANFRAGMFACRQGDLASGFRKLSRAEKGFAALDAATKVRAVTKYLRSLSEQAVALSVSNENNFKIFGTLISPDELSNLQGSQMETILSVLLEKTGGDRALIFVPDASDETVLSSFPVDGAHIKRFTERFGGLIGEEIAPDRPTLLLDCRRDPFINELFSDVADVVASVIVVPFQTSDGAVGYLYLDRLSTDNCLSPFNQIQLNFAVGFSELIAFKWVEIQKNKLLEDNRRLKSQLMKEAAFPNIITCSPEMLSMLAQLRQVVNSNISLSVEGETGCGKDLLARAIHYNSDRKDQRFISVNCAALPESLLESELFGYRRGAFTGADRDKPGLFEEADRGTFFLDEIGDMPLSIQAKVLRILEEKEIVRLGETTPRQVDVRIVSATNRDLKELMTAKQFRQDLYYRLSAMTFRLPPLRDRREDIPLLIEHFLNQSGKQLSAEVLRVLVAYDWPGNVRELENEIKKLILLSGDSAEINIELVSEKICSQPRVESGGNGDAEAATASIDAIEFNDRYGLYDYLAGHERVFIEKALAAKRGIKKHAAAFLNIPESTLRLKIKQYDIDLDQFKRAT
ncbi:MAG: sigma 54-interacting transcriptional regulator [candidate division Zixibacteria bacterium]|nr:sigma 54-interacting transcriptional regulator [candidate division Zixibacteria bacterium]